MVGKSSGADTKTINLAARNQTGQLIFCQGRALYRLLIFFGSKSFGTEILNSFVGLLM